MDQDMERKRLVDYILSPGANQPTYRNWRAEFLSEIVKGPGGAKEAGRVSQQLFPEELAAARAIWHRPSRVA